MHNLSGRFFGQGGRKKIVREVAQGDNPYLQKSADRNAQNQYADLICFAICRFSQVRFITRATSRTIAFSISTWIVFGINSPLLSPCPAELQVSCYFDRAAG